LLKYLRRRWWRIGAPLLVALVAFARFRFAQDYFIWGRTANAGHELRRRSGRIRRRRRILAREVMADLAPGGFGQGATTGWIWSPRTYHLSRKRVSWGKIPAMVKYTWHFLLVAKPHSPLV